MLRFFEFSFFLFPFSLLILFSFSPNKIYAQSLSDLIIVQVPALSRSVPNEPANMYTPFDRYIEKTRIVRFSPGSNQNINLTPDFYAAADPDVSFDGTDIIFAGKKTANDRWQIWQMKSDGSGKIQITQSEGDCYMPVFAGSRFYLDDLAPTPQIIYAGTAHNWKNFVENWPVLSLYGTDQEGKTNHRLTFNLYSDFAPDVLPDGRIVFSSWQLSGRDSWVKGKYAFMGINNDGTDLMTYYGNHETPIYKDMIAVSDNDSRVYFIESDQSHWLGGGDIAQISQQRPLKSYNKLSVAGDGLYHSPCPTADGSLLSSFREMANDDVFAVYRIHPETGKKQEKIFFEQGWHSIDTQLLQAHSKVKGRSNWLIPGSKTGVFYCLDSYMTNNRSKKTLKPGSIKFVRILEGLPLTDEDISSLSESDFSNSGRKYLNPRRILGLAPVEKDGSFQVRVPAQTPVNFQLLDKNYFTVDKQEAWTWVIGNENRGCIGCHEDRELSPPNVLVDAVIKPAVDLTLSEDEVRTVDFRNQIAPLIKTKCATELCHVNGKISPNLEEKNDSNNESFSRHIFEVLLNAIDRKEGKSYILPGNAKDSPLIRHIFKLGENPNEITITHDHMRETSKKELTEQERIIFIEWIDTGAFWDLSSLKMLTSHKKQN